MKNIVILQKNEDGSIYCREVSKYGIEDMEHDYHISRVNEDENDDWKNGGTILLDELDEILDKEI